MTEPNDSGSIVLTPGVPQMKFTGQLPVVWIPKPEELIAGGQWRRHYIPGAGALAALIVVAAGYSVGAWHVGLTAAGLMLDIAGAGLLTTGLMQPEWLIREMGVPRWGENPSISTYWRQTKTDAFVAIALLLGGFALQAVGIALP